MKTNSTSKTAFFIPRAVLSFALCSIGFLLALAAVNKSETGVVRHGTVARLDPTAGAFQKARTYDTPRLTFTIIDAPNHTYGYDVFADGRLLIHQTSVPALPGNEGFQTKEEATKVALLVIEKINKGEMPPTISIDEMTKLNVIK